MIDRLSNWLILSYGWQRALIVLLSGALSALALPPYGLWPVLFVTMPVMAWVMDGAGSAPFWSRLGQGALVGWLFGFGFHLAGLHWIGEAFLVDGAAFSWAMPLGVVALPMGLALFHALGLGLAAVVWPGNAARVLALAAGCTCADIVRSYAFTGFPWNSIGYVVDSSLIFLQSASLMGLFGVGFVVVAVAALPAAIWPLGDSSKLLKTALVGGLLVSVSALGGYGYQRLKLNQTSYVDGQIVRIVQPNIKQTEKWKPENRIDIIRTYLELSDRAASPSVSGIGDVTHIIWPESALPLYLLESQPLLAQVAALLPDTSYLLTGNNRRDQTGFYNSLILIDGGGVPIKAYDKQKLVPFGEYMPLAETMTKLGMEQISQLKLGFNHGLSSPDMMVPGLGVVRALICYEAIFPRLSATKSLRPNLLLNVTNDAWFGFSAGPYQHFAQARMRAVEQGLPMLRAANTGISAVIDPNGRVLERLEMGQRGVLDSPIPNFLEVTTFTRFQHWPAFVMILLSFLICMAHLSRVKLRP